jgi:hypothetical protein
VSLNTPAAPGHALEQVFLKHFDSADHDPAPGASRMMHVFQCGMVSEAALQDLLSDSNRRKSTR